MSPTRVAISSLGCRLNHAEADLMRQQLAQAGLEVVNWQSAAEVRIVNSCCVTSKAAAKTRQRLKKAHQAHRGVASKVVVTGCHAQIDGKSLWQNGLADLVVGNGEKELLAQQVLQWLQNKTTPFKAPIPISQQSFSVGGFDPTLFNTTDELTRAHLKVQDGCSFGCAFCIIPRARGGSRSRQWGELLSEAKARTIHGAKELVLSGVNLGTYRQGAKGLVQLVDALNCLKGLARIRISSIEPTTVRWDLLERMADSQHKLMPFLHLPLQSGSDRILKLMNRRYSSNSYQRFAERACKTVPDLCLGTDVMVGFPSETTQDFQATIDLLRSLPFARLHVFPFSARARTAATLISPTVPDIEKQQRALEVRQLGLIKHQNFMQKYRGKTMPVLFERPKNQVSGQGYTTNYLRVDVHHPQPQQLHNRILPVKMLESGEHQLAGILAESV